MNTKDILIENVRLKSILKLSEPELVERLNDINKYIDGYRKFLTDQVWQILRLEERNARLLTTISYMEVEKMNSWDWLKKETKFKEKCSIKSELVTDLASSQAYYRGQRDAYKDFFHDVEKACALQIVEIQAIKRKLPYCDIEGCNCNDNGPRAAIDSILRTIRPKEKEKEK